jgi:excisionase family DNA binding protein
MAIKRSKPKRVEDWMTTKEVAEALGMTHQGLLHSLKRGATLIPHVRIGQHWRFLRRDVDSWLELKRKLGDPTTLRGRIAALERASAARDAEIAELKAQLAGS